MRYKGMQHPRLYVCVHARTRTKHTVNAYAQLCDEQRAHLDCGRWCQSVDGRRSVWRPPHPGPIPTVNYRVHSVRVRIKT